MIEIYFIRKAHFHTLETWETYVYLREKNICIIKKIYSSKFNIWCTCIKFVEILKRFEKSLLYNYFIVDIKINRSTNASTQEETRFDMTVQRDLYHRSKTRQCTNIFPCLFSMRSSFSSRLPKTTVSIRRAMRCWARWAVRNVYFRWFITGSLQEWLMTEEARPVVKNNKLLQYPSGKSTDRARASEGGKKERKRNRKAARERTISLHR